MSAPSVLERCRMALAEVGYAPDLVVLKKERILMSTTIPEMVRWMVVCTVSTQLMCLPCYERLDVDQEALPQSERAALVDERQDACRADRPFQRQSCGAVQ